ncbi:type II secretion system minor pseudopilin GspI [Escherichia coli]
MSLVISCLTTGVTGISHAGTGNQLQSQDSFGEENTSSSGKELINGEEWNWRSDIHSSKDGTLLERTITVTLPSGQTTSLTRYQSIDNKSGQAQDD